MLVMLNNLQYMEFIKILKLFMDKQQVFINLIMVLYRVKMMEY